MFTRLYRLFTHATRSRPLSLPASGSRPPPLPRPPVFPPSNRIYIGNLPLGATENDLRTQLSSFGPITKVDMPFNGSSHCYAFVAFASQKDATAVFESALDDPLHLRGTVLCIRYAAPGVIPTYIHSPSSRLFFKDFPGGPNEIRKLFAPWKRYVRKVNFLKDRKTHKYTDCGLVTFSNGIRAAEALHGLMKTGEAAKYSLDFPRRVQEPKKEEPAKLPSQAVQARAFTELLDALAQDPNTARPPDWLNLSGIDLKK